MAFPLLLSALLLAPALAADGDATPSDSDVADSDALPIDAYPTGGQTVSCATSPALPLGLGVVALAALATRRRVRPAGRDRRHGGGAVAAVLLTSAFAGTDAVAQETFAARENLQRFQPCGLVNGFVTTCTGRQLAKGKFSFDGLISYAYRPFQQSQRISDTLIRRVKGIDNLEALHLRVAVAATDWLQFSLSGPVVQMADAGRAVATFGGPLDGNPVGAGDLELAIGFRAVDEAKTGFGLAITPIASFPTGSRRLMLTDGAFGFGGRVALSGSVSIVHLAAHAGYLAKLGGSTLGDHVAVDDELRWGGGVGVDLLRDKVRLNAEVLGASILGPARNYIDVTPVTGKLHTPAEAMLDTVVTLPSGFAMTAGVGVGLTPAPGTPVVRGFLGFGYLPWTGTERPIEPEPLPTPVDVPRDQDEDGVADADDQCPAEAEDHDGHADGDGCPDVDDDGDGIPDDRDACRDVAEDPDGHDDEDGCPDVDDDGDGVLDRDDACPLEPEDKDGVDDADGCPEGDVDTDGDGLLDPVDGCPAVAEDKDGFADEDGCPEADNDGDGIADGVDRCPDAAEVRNGVDDEDGCPDEAKARLTADRIEILERVLFFTDEARIRPDSFGVLDAVVAILQQYPDVRRIRIEGHTDAQGSDAYNQDLSERRALAVRQYLVDKGVSATRLLARGYGESYPIAPNATEEGRAANRRVEFVILGAEDEGGL